MLFIHASIFCFDASCFQKDLNLIQKNNDPVSFQKYITQTIDLLSREYVNPVPYAMYLRDCLLEANQNYGSLEEASWKIYPRFAKFYSFLTGIITDSERFLLFDEQKYHIGKLSNATNQKLKNCLAAAKIIPIQQSDIHPEYYSAVGFTAEQEEVYNKLNKFIFLQDEELSCIKEALSEIEDEVTQTLGSSWKILNIRSWRRHPNPIQHDPNGGWHSDGLGEFVFKIMLYPSGCSQKLGTTQLHPDYSITGPEGTWFLFKSSELVHRALSPADEEGAKDRLIVEVTICPALKEDLTPVCAGLLAMRPHIAWYDLAKEQSALIYPHGMGLNIGGGRNWSKDYWINLEKSSDTEKLPFTLRPHCKFPLLNESIATVYTCHVLEHLDDATTYRVLSESHRVLVEGGQIIIKIPDFDEALSAWQMRDEAYFRGRVWDFPTDLFTNYNVEDCLDTRAAFLFGSFATPELNGLFSGKETLQNPKAYFGPPLVSSTRLREISLLPSIHQIGCELRKAILETQKGMPDFGHQNCWSRKELAQLLSEIGFEDISFDKELIMKTWGHIPWMGENMSLSTACIAKKSLKK